MSEHSAGRYREKDTHASITVEDVDVLASIEIIDRTFTINLKGVCKDR